MNLDHLTELPQRRDVGIGCVGAGFIMADCHLVAYRAAGLNILGIAARTRESASRVAARHGIPQATDQLSELLDNPAVEVVDVAVPPNEQAKVIREIVKRPHIRGILAQKPLGMDYAEAAEIVALCAAAGKTLAVNQNMRHDHSVRAAKNLLNTGVLGQPVLATIDMRAIPHWMPWQQELGWVTLRIMSIHHLDTLRFWFGNPHRVFSSHRPDPRTTFPHEDGICLTILEYTNGLRCMVCDDVWAGPAKEGAAADIGIHWRLEGTTGQARGSIGWPSYPERTPSTLDWTTTEAPVWHKPRWSEVWFPDAFIGPMADLLRALETNAEPETSGLENLGTMAIVEAGYRSAKEHRAVALSEIDPRFGETE